MDSMESYIERVNKYQEAFPQEHANLLIGLANTACTMIKQRIQKTGIDANGNKFRNYSEWYQIYKTEKGKNKGFTDFSFTTRMWTNIQLILDKSTENVAIITAIDKGSKGTNISVPVKAHTRKGYSRNGKSIPAKKIAATTKSVYVPSNYEKLEKNTSAFGEILNLSKVEIEDLRFDYENGILDIRKKYGL